jgi:tetratricopeptide (TPR) repeat protein
MPKLKGELLIGLTERYKAAIEELEETLRICTVSPTEKMAILSNLGYAYYLIGNHQRALENYHAILKLTPRVKEKEASSGVFAALGNIGVIYSVKGDLDNALKYHQDSLKIAQEIGYRLGEANALGKIGIIYLAKRDSDSARRYLESALRILDTAKLTFGRDLFLSALNSIKGT